MSEVSIYETLRNAGLTAEGACGLMGNMMAESSMKANIAQRGLTKLSDEEYTKRFDAEPVIYRSDAVGYGLCQWTYWSRKRDLWEYAHMKNKSVGDEQTQVEFCIKELRGHYDGLFGFLCTTKDIYSAAERVCKEYEQPAVNNIAPRYAYAVDFYEKLADTTVDTSPDFPPDLSIMLLQAVLNYNNYSCRINGYKDREFLTQLREFVTDLGG